jgi:hypothetical protein
MAARAGANKQPAMIPADGKSLREAWGRWSDDISTITRMVSACTEPDASGKGYVIVLDFDRFVQITAVIGQSVAELQEAVLRYQLERNESEQESWLWARQIVVRAALGLRVPAPGSLPLKALQLLWSEVYGAFSGKASARPLEQGPDGTAAAEPDERKRRDQLVLALRKDKYSYVEICKRLDHAGLNSPWPGLTWTAASRKYPQRVKTWLSKAARRAVTQRL